MISRVADHCFWLGRYLERAESAARLLFVTRNLELDGELTPEQVWHPIIIVSGEEEHFSELLGEEAAGNGEMVQKYLTWDLENGTSIVRSVGAARENARAIREVVSLETWEAVNALHLWLGSDAGAAEWATNRFGFYRHVREGVQLALGLMRSTMLHELPLDFIWLGLMLERVSQTARILDVHHHGLASAASRHQVVDTALWLTLLRTLSGFEPFMKRFQGRVSPGAVASFLICEPRFPRSVRFCLDAANASLAKIRPANDPKLPGADTQRRLRALVTRVVSLTPAEVAEAAGGADAARGGTALHELLTAIVDETHGVCEGLGRELFGAGS